MGSVLPWRGGPRLRSANPIGGRLRVPSVVAALLCGTVAFTIRPLGGQGPPEPGPGAPVAGQRRLAPLDLVPRPLDPSAAGVLAARAFSRLTPGSPGGESHVWVRVDATGAPTTAAIGFSSGDGAIDEAALWVARELEYAPGARRDSARAAWVGLTIRISPDGTGGLRDASPFIDPLQSIPPGGRSGPDSAIAYWEAGEGSSTVFFLHGGPGTHHRYLRPEWDALAGFGRLVYYDQRGCGASGWGSPQAREELGWQTHIADLDRLIADRRGEGPVILFGSSWGSELALAYAIVHPDRVDAIVLSGYPGWAPDTFRTEDGRSRVASREERDAAAARAPPPHRADTLFAGPTRRLSPAEARSALGPRVRLCPEAYRRTWTSMATMPGADRLAGIQVPVLVLSGDLPDAVPEAGVELAGTLPRGHLFLVEGAGHDPWFTHPDRVIPFVEGWLRTTLEAPPRDRSGGPDVTTMGTPD